MLRQGLAIGMCAVLAAACKGDGPAKDKSAKMVEATTSSPERGGHLRVPSNEPTYLNPALEIRFDIASTLLFEGLVGVDAKLDPVPRLAEKWEISDDGKVITFHLRKNVVWQDGEKLTAKDVKFTVENILKPEIRSVWKGHLSPIASVETPDDSTVVVKYSQSYAPALMSWTVPILPAHVFGAEPFTTARANTEPVGTGPYRLMRWEKGKRMLLEANPRWWFGKPHIETIEILFGISDADLLDQLRRGQLDWTPIRAVDDWIETQTAEFRSDFDAADVVESRIRMIAWNTLKEPLDDKRVRQALTLALDRQRVVEDVLQGQAQILSGPFFPTMFGPDPAIAPMPFDLARAKKLLDEVAPAKGAQRFPLEIIASESLRGPVTDASFAIFRRDLASLGIDLKLSILPRAEYEQRMAKRDFDGAYFGWLPDLPDPDPFSRLHSSQIDLGFNYARYTNDDVDKLLEQARETTNRDARRTAYAKIHAIVADEMPYTPLYAPYGHYAWTRRLRGVNPRDLGAPPLVPGAARWWFASRP